jgi:hypothetical protein
MLGEPRERSSRLIKQSETKIFSGLTLENKFAIEWTRRAAKNLAIPHRDEKLFFLAR